MRGKIEKKMKGNEGSEGGKETRDDGKEDVGEVSEPVKRREG